MQQISRSIINWYQTNKRDLPWRQTADPYHIWLSEVILQQTRVAQGTAYYYRFLEKFPTVKKLSQASEDEVLEIWQGLGYYSRARNLHSAAKHIANELDGHFPSNYDGLLKLKGIGEYTAAAIASFAYHEDKAVVDGNVIRVISRLYKIEEDVRSPKVVGRIKEITQSLLPPGNAYLFNQALMELGALVCIPRNPSCGTCPVSTHCEARTAGIQEKIPFKSKLKARRVRFLNYLLVEVDEEVYFKKRGPKDIWEGLYEPILFEMDHAFDIPNEFLKGMPPDTHIPKENVQVLNLIRATKHILSHQELWVTLCHVRLQSKPGFGGGKWVNISELDRLPKPVIFSKMMGQKMPSQLPLVF